MNLEDHYRRLVRLFPYPRPFVCDEIVRVLAIPGSLRRESHNRSPARATATSPHQRKKGDDDDG
jgi:hypothetical protein